MAWYNNKSAVGWGIGAIILLVLCVVFIALYATQNRCSSCPACTCADLNDQSCCTGGQTCQAAAPIMTCQVGQGAQLLTASAGPYSYYNNLWHVRGDGAIQDTAKWTYSCPAGMLFHEDPVNNVIWCSPSTNCTNATTDQTCTAQAVNSQLCEWLPVSAP